MPAVRLDRELLPTMLGWCVGMILHAARFADRDLVGLGHHRFVTATRVVVRGDEPREVAAGHRGPGGDMRCVKEAAKQ